MPGAKDRDISITIVAEALSLDAATPSGLRWRERPLTHFGDDVRERRRWNTRYAGKAAGWKRRGYLVVTLKVGDRLRRIMAHRVVFALVSGRWPIDQIDPEDRNRAANKIETLREATYAQNMQNASLRSDNTSGVRGVTWHKRYCKWQARIAVNRHHFHLGYFDTFEEARNARWGAESVLHPFRAKPRPLDPGVYRFDTKPKRVTFTDV